MFMRSAAFVAATIVGLVAAPVSAATTYDATSHFENGSPEHSVWFSGNSNPNGSTGPKGNHFLFENSAAGVGNFTVTGNTASLTGIVKNAFGDAFQVMLNFVQVGDPGAYKQVAGSSRADWTFYDLTSGMLNSLTPGIKSFDLALRGGETINNQFVPYKVQVGTGANDKDPFLYGLSTWFTATEKNCMYYCERYNGDFNLVLKPGGGTGVVPLPASLLLLPAALGMLGAAGGITRRRRRS